MLNLLSLILNLVSGVVISIIFLPIYTKYLGVETIGMIGIANNLTTFIYSFGTAAVFVFAREYQHSKEKKKYRKEILTITSSILFFLSILIVSFSLNHSFIYMIVETLELDLLYFIQMVMFSIAINCLALLFQIFSFSEGKIYIYNSINSISNILRHVIFTFYLINGGGSLSYLGEASVLASAIALIVNISIYRKKISLTKTFLFQRQILKAVKNTCIVFFTSCLAFFINYIDLFLVLKLFGKKESGIYLLLMTIPLIVRNFGNLYASLFSPIVNSIKSDTEILSLSLKTMKNTMIIFFVPFSILIFNTNHLLGLWLPSLKEGDIDDTVLTWLLLITYISVIFFPLVNSLNSKKKFKELMNNSLISILLCVFMLFLIPMVYDMTIYGVALIFCTTVFIKNVLLNSILFNKSFIFQFKELTSLLVMFFFVMVLFLSLYLCQVYLLNNYSAFLVVQFLIYFVFIIIFVLKEIKFIKNLRVS